MFKINRIKYLREEKGMSQSEIGKILGITSQAVGLYENEKRDIPNEYLIKLANYFNCSIDFLLGKSDIRKSDAEIKQEFEFAYHKEAEGLTDEEIADAIRFYKQIKYGKKDNK